MENMAHISEPKVTYFIFPSKLIEISISKKKLSIHFAHSQVFHHGGRTSYPPIVLTFSP